MRRSSYCYLSSSTGSSGGDGAVDAHVLYTDDVPITDQTPERGGEHLAALLASAQPGVVRSHLLAEDVDRVSFRHRVQRSLEEVVDRAQDPASCDADPLVVLPQPARAGVGRACDPLHNR